jgi:hypothetical protein
MNNRFLTGFDRVFLLFLKLKKSNPTLFLGLGSGSLSLILAEALYVGQSRSADSKRENVMKAEKLFKKMQKVGFVHEKKRKPPKPSEKWILKKLPEKTAPPSIHRYGPKDRPSPLSEFMSQDRKNVPTVSVEKPLAYCMVCRGYMPMKWKPRNKRGNKVEEWFVCETCGNDRLEIKILTKEAK